jgi:hypothetical protein
MFPENLPISNSGANIRFIFRLGDEVRVRPGVDQPRGGQYHSRSALAILGELGVRAGVGRASRSV